MAAASSSDPAPRRPPGGLPPGMPEEKRARMSAPGKAVTSLNIDDTLKLLLKVRRQSPENQEVFVSMPTLDMLCQKAIEVFNSQEILLDLEPPLRLCGDIHGQYHDLLRIFDVVGFPPVHNYLFLGDYVDRGKRSLETVCLLFAYKIKYPENFFLLRGNHETPSICRIYGFYDEVKQRHGVKCWKMFCDVFNYLPLCAIIKDRVICMHGGISQEMVNTNQYVQDTYNIRDLVQRVQRPCDIPNEGFMCDLLWADPGEVHPPYWFGPNERGVSVAFGREALAEFLRQNDLDLIVRAHQVVEDGYEFFGGNKQLVTIFSAPNYCGEFDNAASVLSIQENLLCSFQVIKPAVQG